MVSLLRFFYFLTITAISLCGTESLSRKHVKESDLEDTIKGRDEHEQIRVIRGMQKLREDILTQIRYLSDEVSDEKIDTHNQTQQGFLRPEWSEHQMSSKRHHKPTRHFFFGNLTVQNGTNGRRHRLHIEALLDSRKVAQWSTSVRDVTLFLPVNKEQLRHQPQMFVTSSFGTPRKSNIVSGVTLPPQGQGQLKDNTTTWLSFRLSRVYLLRQIRNVTHDSVSANIRVEFTVECFNCTSEYSTPVTAQSPVLMVTVVSGKSHSHRSQRRRRSDCSSQGCCLKTIDATVDDLGLTMIMAPDKFKLSYCAGSCTPEPIQKSLSGPIRKMLRISLRQTGLWRPCCSPSQTRSVPIDVTFGDGLLFSSSKMWLEETMKCGCN